MLALPLEVLGQVCRIFLKLAYPAGPDSIPAPKQAYLAIDACQSLADYLPPAPRAAGVARPLPNSLGQTNGYEFRLGSAHFPHLKLRVQEVENHAGPTWVFMVDTHDHFPRVDHGADESAWRLLQEKNRALKEAIETALETEGFMTPNKLLRGDLAGAAAATRNNGVSQ